MAEVRRGLQLYEDFSQRKAFARLVKIRKDQHALPIAAYERAIVDSIRANRVTLIAGDTGCGKSTQVPQYMLRAGNSNVRINVCSFTMRFCAFSPWYSCVCVTLLGKK